MSGLRTLAEVEAQVALMDDESLTGLEQQRDAWEAAARDYARAIRRIHRHLILLRSRFANATRYQELTHVIEKVVAPELVDQEPASSGGDPR